MKIELVERSKNELNFWQGGFTLKDENKNEVLVYGTTMPAGMPLIFVKDGPNKGKTYTVKLDHMKKVCQLLLEKKFESKIEK